MVQTAVGTITPGIQLQNVARRLSLWITQVAAGRTHPHAEVATEGCTPGKG